MPLNIYIGITLVKQNQMIERRSNCFVTYCKSVSSNSSYLSSFNNVTIIFIIEKDVKMNNFLYACYF